ncbi:solute carrier family 22 member 18-like [Clytia hemisphaerica]|uniref:solute carrier family 22 member 18-like n=1 Tax=Clytia hemisphaerica TaxID=252671 RepID=UPI0034D52200
MPAKEKQTSDSGNTANGNNMNSKSDFTAKKRKFHSFVKKTIASIDDEDTQIEPHFQRKITLIFIALHVAAFVQSVGFFIQNTSYPYLTKSLGVNPQVYGYTISFHAIMNLIGGPICGWASDIYGGRLTLIIAFVMLMISYFMLGVARTIPMLFLAKVPRIAAHPLQSMYIIISDITYPEGRADMMGKLGVSSGLGMIVGSGIGGFITSHFGNRIPFFVAIVVDVLCILVTLALIPRDTTHIREHLEPKRKNEESLEKIKCKEEEKKKSFLGIGELVAVTKRKHMIYLLTIKIITAFPFSVLSAMFTLLLMDYYKLSPKENGMVLSYLGVVGMITQGYLIGLFCRHVSDGPLIIISTITMAVGFLYLIIAESIYVFCLTCIPLTVGGSLLHIVTTSIITKVVKKEETGSALGVTLCTHSSIRSVAPTIGGFLFQHVGFYTFGVLGYGVNFLITIYLLFFGRDDFSVGEL